VPFGPRIVSTASGISHQRFHELEKREDSMTELRRSRLMLFAIVLIVMIAVVIFQANSILSAIGGLHR
jgi:hypothetical protein